MILNKFVFDMKVNNNNFVFDNLCTCMKVNNNKISYVDYLFDYRIVLRGSIHIFLLIFDCHGYVP
jgi:hypothetical protein